MEVLVLSDIHANWSAGGDRRAHDVCICLGDLVDYGPDPAQCVRWAMENAQYAIRAASYDRLAWRRGFRSRARMAIAT